VTESLRWKRCNTHGAASVTATEMRRTRSLSASDCISVVVADRMSRCRAMKLRELPTYPNTHSAPTITPHTTKLNSSQLIVAPTGSRASSRHVTSSCSEILFRDGSADCCDCGQQQAPVITQHAMARRALLSGCAINHEQQQQQQQPAAAI